VDLSKRRIPHNINVIGKQNIMKIRSAMLSDAEKIYLTHKASIETLCAGHYSEQDIAKWIDILSPSIYENAINEKVMIIAEDGDDLLGLGILDAVNKEICAIYIHPISKGIGLGKRILLELENRAHEKGIDYLTLCSTTNALGFYEHHGYNKEGHTFHELPNGVKLECTQMRKTLNKN
jgi:putative acetyltransferase